MNKVPMLERFAAQSLVEHDGELIFSKEKFAELIVIECAELFPNVYVSIETEHGHTSVIAADYIKEHFGVE